MNPTSTSVMYTCLWSYWLAPGISGIPNEDGKTFLFRKNRLLQFKQLLPIWTFGNKNRKIQKKIFETLEQKYIVLREMFFYCYLSTKQRWKCKARDVTCHLRYFDDAIKFGLRKKCFLCLIWDISQSSLLKYNVSSVRFAIAWVICSGLRLK